jgi:tight adherence protein C
MTDLTSAGIFIGLAGLLFLVITLALGARRRKQDPSKLADLLAQQVAAAELNAPQGILRDLHRAGYYRPTARLRFSLFRATLVVAILAVAATLVTMAGPEHMEVALRIAFGGLILATLAFSLPRVLLSANGNARVHRIEAGLPDAMDMIGMCVSGGLPFTLALKRVSEEIAFSHEELAFELAIVERHSDVATVGQAMRNFAHRLDSSAIRSLSSIVRQAERLGTNVAGALAEHADNIRFNRRQRADERANKTGIRMLFPLTFCLAPSVFLLLWGPALLELRAFINNERGAGGVLEQQIDDQLTLNGNIAPRR